MPDEDLPREADNAVPEASPGLPEAEFSDLMGSISAMAPLLRGFLSKEASYPKEDREDHGPTGLHRGDCHRREALLLALKPYLSPARCAAVDYFIRLSRVGDAIRSLQ